MELGNTHKATRKHDLWSQADSADVSHLLPQTLRIEARRAGVPSGLLNELARHVDGLRWLDDQGVQWDRAFFTDAMSAHAGAGIGEFIVERIAGRIDQLFGELYHQKASIGDADARRFVARMLIGKDGRLNLSCMRPLSNTVVWCETNIGSLLNVMRLRLKQFDDNPKLVALFNSIGRHDDGSTKIHPHAQILMQADLEEPGGLTLSPQEIGLITLRACIWPERQGEVGICAILGPQSTVYLNDFELVLTELKSLVEDGALHMVFGEPLNLEILCACQLSKADLRAVTIDAGTAVADPTKHAEQLLERMPSLRRAFDFMHGKPLDPKTHNTIMKDALSTLAADKASRKEPGTALSASLWDICLAALANPNDVSLTQLKELMSRPLTSSHPIVPQLRKDVEKARLALISSTHSILSKAWFEVLAQATSRRARQSLCDAIVAELFPTWIVQEWPGGSKAKADFAALLMQKCQLLAHEEVDGFRLFVRTATMGELGSRVTSADQFSDCMASLIDEWAAQVLQTADGSSGETRAKAVREILELCRDSRFATRVNGRLPSDRFRTPWLTLSGTVSTRHSTIDGVRHLAAKPRKEVLIKHTFDLIEHVLADTASRRNELASLSDVEKCSARLDLSARGHRFAVLYAQPCWEHLQASGMKADDWLNEHLSEPGRLWAQQPWDPSERASAWAALSKVVPNYDVEVDRKFIADNGGNASPEKFIKAVQSLIGRKGTKGEAKNLVETLSLAIACIRGAQLFVVADLNYDGADSLLCVYYDPCRNSCRYVRSSDHLDPPLEGDAAGLPRARSLAVETLEFYGDAEGGSVSAWFW